MDADQLARLIDSCAAPLELSARQWCDDPADVVQTAFVRLIEQDPLPDRPQAWLYCVVRNLALSRRRSARRRQHYERSAVRAISNWFDPAIGEELDGEAATQALSQLPDEQREVLLAHIWGGLTFEDIGAAMETSSSTAHRRYAEGIQLLRKKLGVPCPNSD